MTDLDGIVSLSKDDREQALQMGVGSVRSLVSSYYQWQSERQRFASQARAADKEGKPSGLQEHFAGQVKRLERQIKTLLGEWAAETVQGEWAQRQYGVGPVISAGLVSHINIERAPTAGSLWKFAGLAPPDTYPDDWSDGRPWNADLKSLLWNMAECFKRFSKRDKCFYGHLYLERKEYEEDRNNRGGNEEAAQRTLDQRSNLSDNQLKYYEAGKLPPGRLDLRAERWVEKIFLSHYHVVNFADHFDRLPPRPYSIEHLNHAHVIPVPHPPTHVQAMLDAAGRVA